MSLVTTFICCHIVDIIIIIKTILNNESTKTHFYCVRTKILTILPKSLFNLFLFEFPILFPIKNTELVLKNWIIVFFLILLFEKIFKIRWYDFAHFLREQVIAIVRVSSVSVCPSSVLELRLKHPKL